MIHPSNAKSIICYFIVLFLLLMQGCANTVVIKDAAETEITFSITFESEPDFSNNNYYIIYGNSENIDINYLRSTHYFFIPGESYDSSVGESITDDGINYFYDNFFESWAGILTLKSEDLSITEGPFTSSSESDEADRITDHLSYISTNLSIDNYSYSSSGTLTFTIASASLNLESDILYFTIATSTGNNLNNINDLVGDIQIIEVVINSPPTTATNDTSAFPQLVGAANIESWTITVQ